MGMCTTAAVPVVYVHLFVQPFESLVRRGPLVEVRTMRFWCPIYLGTTTSPIFGPSISSETYRLFLIVYST